MLIELLGVLEDGSPPAPTLPHDTRKPLELVAGQVVTFRLHAVTRAGAPVVLAAGHELVATARESTVRPSRRYWSVTFAADPDRDRGWYYATLPAAPPQFLGGLYGVWDLWYKRPGADDALIKPSQLYIAPGAIDAVAPAPAAVLDQPAGQNGAERSFPWTATVTGTTQAVTIPGSGMRDLSFVVAAFNLRDAAPGDGAHPDARFPGAGRTLTTFTVVTDAPIRAGSSFDVVLRDSVT